MYATGHAVNLMVFSLAGYFKYTACHHTVHYILSEDESRKIPL